MLQGKRTASCSAGHCCSVAVAQLSVIPGTAAHAASLRFAIIPSSLRPMSVELTMPSNHRFLCPPSHFALNLPQHQSLFQWVSSNESLHIRWPDYWSFSFSISLSNEYSGLISFRMDWLDLRAKGLSEVFSNNIILKHVFRHSAFFTIRFSCLYMTTGETTALIIGTFVLVLQLIFLYSFSLHSLIIFILLICKL